MNFSKLCDYVKHKSINMTSSYLNEDTIIGFIKRNVLSKYILSYNCRYVNDSIDCCLGGVLNENDVDGHFIHSTNYLFHIVFEKPINLRVINDMPIREGLKKGIYYKKLDNVTFALGFIYEANEEILDENLNKIINPVVYNNLYIVGLHCEKWIRIFTNDFIRLEKLFNDKADNIMKNIQKKMNDKEKENNEFSSVYINGCVVKCKALSDIIMDDKTREDLKFHIVNFIKNKELYTKHNVKYKLGILLYGEPGTGKTTLIHSIVSYINEIINGMDNAILSGAEECFSIENNRRGATERNRTSSRVSNAYSNNPVSKSTYYVKIIEEFDTYFEDSVTDATKDGNFKYNRGASKKDVVDFIDKCTDGTIFIASTNHLERIKEFDSALVRPGRFDIFIEMKPFEREQAEQFANWFELQDKSFLNDIKYPVMPSELEYMIQAKLYEQINNKLYEDKNET